MYKCIERLKYHIFTGGKDLWVKNKKELIKVIREWRNYGERNIRAYTIAWDKEEGIYNDVDNIFSAGVFPL